MKITLLENQNKYFINNPDNTSMMQNDNFCSKKD